MQAACHASLSAFHHSHKREKVLHEEEDEIRRRKERGSIHHTGVNTTNTITGAAVSTFSPSQEEQEDSQEEFQT